MRLLCRSRRLEGGLAARLDVLEYHSLGFHMAATSQSSAATNAANSGVGKVEAQKMYETVKPLAQRGIMPSKPTRRRVTFWLVGEVWDEETWHRWPPLRSDNEKGLSRSQMRKPTR